MERITKFRVKVVPNVYGSCIVYEPYTKLTLENGE